MPPPPAAPPPVRARAHVNANARFQAWTFPTAADVLPPPLLICPILVTGDVSKDEGVRVDGRRCV